MPEEQNDINPAPETPQVVKPKVTELPPVNADEERAKLGKLNWDNGIAGIMTESEALIPQGGSERPARRTTKRPPQY